MTLLIKELYGSVLFNYFPLLNSLKTIFKKSSYGLAVPHMDTGGSKKLETPETNMQASMAFE